MNKIKCLILGILLLCLAPQNSHALGIVTYNLIVNQDMTTSFISQSANITNQSIGSIQATWTGTPNGTIYLEISNDNVNFSTYTGSSTPVVDGGNFTWNMLFLGFRYVRVVYAAASGTGTVNASVLAKGD